MKSIDVLPPELDTLLRPKADRRRNNLDRDGTTTDECIAQPRPSLRPRENPRIPIDEILD